MKAVDAERARRIAHIGGFLYLLIILLGGLGEALVRGRIVVESDPAATVANLRSMEWLWRVGVAGELLLLSFTVVLALILYVLLREVNRELALLAAFFNLMCVAVEAVAAVSLASALFPLTGPLASAMHADRVGEVVMLAIRSHEAGFGVALVFFGIECLILGHLIYHSGFIPGTIGRLMQLAGLCYLVNSFTLILSPAVSSIIFPAILLPVLLGEGSLALWLLFKGVRPDRWKGDQEAAPERAPVLV